MASERLNITSPVGRIVAGSLSKPITTDFDGKPLTTKTGQNAGQPRVNFFFALAIPKGAETHWAHTEWGKLIWGVGHQSFPQAAQRPDFAWKIEDGDSTIPNKRNKRPCDNEGWPRHWVLRFSGGYAPKVYKMENGAFVQIMEEGFVKPGYFVQVAFNVDGNANHNNPGVYLNHSMVCFAAYGPEISFGPDVNEAGFGAAPLPAGASLVPLGASIPMPAAPAAPGMSPNVPAGYPAPPPAPPAAPVPVSPNPAFLQMPPAPPNPSYAAHAGVPSMPAPSPAALPGATTVYPSNVAPPPPPAAPAGLGYRMTEKAQGASREAFLTAGWTDAQLIQNGLMVM